MRIRVGWPELLGCVLAVLVIGGMVLRNGRVAAAQKEAQAAETEEVAPEFEEIITSGGVTIQLVGDRLVADDGTEVGRVATKTQVTEAGSHVSGVLSMTNQDDGAFISLPTKIAKVGFAAGMGVELFIEDITTAGWAGPNPQPEVGHDYTVAIYIFKDGAVISDHEFAYFELADAGPWNVVRTFAFSATGQRAYRTETTTPGVGREDSPVYADEVSEADAWVAEYPGAWEVTFGSLSESGVIAAEEGWGALQNVQLYADQHKGTGGTKYVDFEVAWAGVDCDFSRYVKDLGNWSFQGVSDGVEVFVDVTDPGLNDNHGVAVGRPLAVDFSEFRIPNRDGTSADLLCVIGPWQASNHYGPSINEWSTDPDGQSPGGASPGDSVYPNSIQLRALGTFVNLAGVIGMDFRVAADSHKLITSASQRFSKTRESVIFYEKEYGHDPDDLEIPIKVPGVDQTTCDLSAQVDYDILTMEHAGPLGLYGKPGDLALANDSHVGTGNVGTPLADGTLRVG